MKENFKLVKRLHYINAAGSQQQKKKQVLNFPALLLTIACVRLFISWQLPACSWQPD
jgi:hypothetical protein